MRMTSREVNAAATARMEHKQMSKKEGLLHALEHMGQIDIDAEAYALIKNEIGPDVVVTERAGGKYCNLKREAKKMKNPECETCKKTFADKQPVTRIQGKSYCEPCAKKARATETYPCPCCKK